MELLMWSLLGGGVVLFIYAVHRAVSSKRRREAHGAEIKAASEAASKRKMVEALPASEGPFVRTSRNWRSSPNYTGTATAPTPAPTVVHDSGNPLLYGAIGYMLASSGNSHANSARGQEAAAFDSCKPEPEAPSTWHGSDSSSSDSGSSSSYDSSGSSDSGGGGSSSD